MLSAGIDNLPVSGSDRFNIGSDFMTMRRIGIQQELSASDKRRLRSAQVERTADKATAEKEAAIARVERETAQATDGRTRVPAGDPDAAGFAGDGIGIPLGQGQ